MAFQYKKKNDPRRQTLVAAPDSPEEVVEKKAPPQRGTKRPRKDLGEDEPEEIDLNFRKKAKPNDPPAPAQTKPASKKQAAAAAAPAPAPRGRPKKKPTTRTAGLAADEIHTLLEDAAEDDQMKLLAELVTERTLEEFAQKEGLSAAIQNALHDVGGLFVAAVPHPKGGERGQSGQTGALRPNPRNVENAANVTALRDMLKRLRAEEATWERGLSSALVAQPDATAAGAGSMPDFVLTADSDYLRQHCKGVPHICQPGSIREMSRTLAAQVEQLHALSSRLTSRSAAARNTLTSNGRLLHDVTIRPLTQGLDVRDLIKR